MPQFTKGASGNPHGRRKGTPNTATVEMRELAQQLVDSPAYRRQLKARLLDGSLPPMLERELWAYAYGRPVEQVRVENVQPPVDYIGATASLREKLSHLLADKLARLPVECPNCASRTDAAKVPPAPPVGFIPAGINHTALEYLPPGKLSGVHLLDADEPPASADEKARTRVISAPAPAPSAPARDALDADAPAPTLAQRLSSARERRVRLWGTR